MKPEEGTKLNRRIAGMLKARLSDLVLDQVDDRRRSQGRRWPLATLLKSVLLGLMTGCNSLAEVESLTAEMSPWMRGALGIARRVADTTLRNVLVRLHPYVLRQMLYRLVKAALRRKALPLTGLPFHAAALDGKATSTDTWDHHYAQQQTYDDGKQAHGLVRTVNVVLVSTPAKPVLDSVPIPAETNEMGIFPVVFEALVRTYGALVRLVTYDAGATSQEHCRLVVEAGKDFLFRIKNDTWHLMKEAKRLLGAFPVATAKTSGHTEDVLSKGTSVHRYVFLCAVVGESSDIWSTVRTIVRVVSEKVTNGKVVSHEDRYYISSLKATELSLSQWLLLVRNHWAVENACHWTADVIFEEDKRPWIVTDPRGTVVMMLLRRIAYNLLALFRAVTQRSEEKRQTPWKDLLRWFYNAAISATAEQVADLRARKVAPVFS